METITTKPIGFCWYTFNGVHPDWASKMNAYTVSIWRDNRDNFKEFDWFQGTALDDPTKESVLECLVSEWQTIEGTGGDFMDWVDSFGTGETKSDWVAFNAIQSNSKKLLELFTVDELWELYNYFSEN